MELSYFQRKQFFEQGYLHVTGVLPKVMLDEAMRQINHSVGEGMDSPHNGVPFGEIRNFTMLVGVFLSDVTGPYSGNFTVWPGTHTIFEEYFREHGPMSLLDGMPKVEMPQPVQLNVKAGD